ncbi:MAG TPA: CpsB/CapC family capsule biosynthesis tyrosine phosphatase [Niastella sp.]
MFSIFNKKKRARLDLSGLVADMHSHLLPGIDDGSPDTETSLQLINGLQELGYRKFITTPHILWDMYKNDANTIDAAYQELQEAAQQQNNAAVPIKAAAEYFLDEHFDELLENNVPLLTLHRNWVLVEFSFVTTPLNFKDKLFNMQMKGYQPVLAHPERYLYFMSDRKWYDELKEAGCLFQLNILSLTGYYGKASLQLAQYLIGKRYINLLGTDCHHFRHLNTLRNAHNIMEPVSSLLDSGQLLNPSL